MAKRAPIEPGQVWRAKYPNAPHPEVTVLRQFLLTSPLARPGIFGVPSVEVRYPDGSEASMGVGELRSQYRPALER